MKAAILALTTLIIGVWLSAIAITGAGARNETSDQVGAILPTATPAKRPMANRNMNAANTAANTARGGGTNLANTATGMLPDGPISEPAACIEKPTGKEDAYLDFLTAQDFIDASDKALIADDTLDRSKKFRREAIRCLTFALSADPSNRTFLLKRAEVNEEDPLTAVEDITKVIEASPGEAELYALRAEARGTAEQYEAEVADYTKAISLDPKNSGFYMRRALLYQTQFGDTDKALFDINRALEIRPRDGGALMYRADIYKQRKEYAKAIKDFDTLIENDTQFYLYYLSRAELFETTGEIQKAIDDVNAAIKLEPDNYLAYGQRAKLYRKAGQNALALKDEKTGKSVETKVTKPQ